MDGVGEAVRSYRDLLVWKDSIELAAACYNATKGFLSREAFGMMAQIRRAAASIPANIAEGYGRETNGAFIQFLRIAQGSLKELETHLILAERVSLLPAATHGPLLCRTDEIGKMLRAMIRKLQEKSAS